MLEQHSRAEAHILKHFILQSSWLQQQRVTESAQTAPQQIELGAPIEPVPLSQQLFAETQLGLPFLPPVGPQAARHDHADELDQPQMRVQKTSSFITRS